MSFTKSVLSNSKKFDEPFVHWELNKPLTDGQIMEIINNLLMIKNYPLKTKNLILLYLVM